jgi:hypothetical protein
MCKSVDVLFTNSDEARVHPTHLLRHLDMCPSLELFNIISKLEHTWKLGDGNAKLATPSNRLVIIIIILCHFGNTHMFFTKLSLCRKYWFGLM